MLQIYNNFINKDLVHTLSPGVYFSGGAYLPLIYVKFRNEPDRAEFRSPDTYEGVSCAVAMQMAVDDIIRAIENPL